MIEQAYFPLREKQPFINHFQFKVEKALRSLQNGQITYDNDARLINKHILKTAFSETETRGVVCKAIDRLSEQQSRTLKEGPPVYSPVLIIGTGPHATAFATQYLALADESSVLFVDKSEKRGGQFRFPSKSYQLNSSNVSKDPMGTSLRDNNPNDLSSYSLMQVNEFSKTQYPTSEELGQAILLNNYLAGKAMLGVEVKEVKRNKTSNLGKYEVTLWDADTKRYLHVYTDVVVNATGMGEPNKVLTKEVRGNMKRVLTFYEFMQMLQKMDTQQLRALLENKKLAVIGAGDSAYVIIETIIELMSKRNVSIDLFGTKFNTYNEFKTQTIDRYSHLGNYFIFPQTEHNENDRDGITVRPFTQKVTTVSTDSVGNPTISIHNEKMDYDLVIDATGFTNSVENLYKEFTNDIQASLTKVVDYRNNVQIGTKLANEDIYFVGPAANIEYTHDEQQHVPSNMQRRFQNSLRRLIPRTELVAYHLAMQHRLNSKRNYLN